MQLFSPTALDIYSMGITFPDPEGHSTAPVLSWEDISSPGHSSYKKSDRGNSPEPVRYKTGSFTSSLYIYTWVAISASPQY